MSKRAFIGINNVARKVKKGYLGLGGVARKIKKSYIGIGGVARPYLSGGELVYFGHLPSSLEYGNTGLKYAWMFSNNGMSSAKVNKKALRLYQSGSPQLYIITDDLSWYKHASHSYDSYIYRAPATNSSNALFGGGKSQYASSYGTTDTVIAFDSQLSKITVPNLSKDRRNICGVISDCEMTMFAGGVQANTSGLWDWYVNNVDAYDESLTHMNTTVSESKSNISGAYFNEHFLFLSGQLDSGVYSKKVEIFDKNLTRTFAEDLGDHAASTTDKNSLATVGNYLLCPMTGASMALCMEVYDSAFTKSVHNTNPNFPFGTDPLGASVTGFAVFFTLGLHAIYDESLTSVMLPEFSSEYLTDASRYPESTGAISVENNLFTFLKYKPMPNNSYMTEVELCEIFKLV